MADIGSIKTPKELLVEEISTALVSAGIVPEKCIEDIQSKLIKGGVTGDDWTNWISMAYAQVKTEGMDHG